MPRKRRHPAQVMEFGEMVEGEEYAFVCQGKPPEDCCNVFDIELMGGDGLYSTRVRVAAVLTDTLRTVQERGFRSAKHIFCCDCAPRCDCRPPFEWLYDHSMKRYVSPPFEENEIIVHMDGWTPEYEWDLAHCRPAPTLPVNATLWGDGLYNCDEQAAFFETCVSGSTYVNIIVPFNDWKADPRIHVLDWVNPDDVVEPLRRTPATGSLAATERKRDDIFRRIFS